MFNGLVHFKFCLIFCFKIEFNVDRKFSSLPHRKKKSKPLGRSVSDASQKKPKRSSIFNLFSKRSDPNLSTAAATATESPRTAKRTGKPVGRSKSDVGYNSSHLQSGNAQNKTQTVDRKRIKIPDSDESMSKAKKKSQLSPISENPPAEKLFGFTPDERKLLRYTKSEEKRLAPALDSMNSDEDEYRPSQQQLIATSTTIPKHSRSLENLHSSQLPQEKLPLTKGLKVDGMVKRLSMDRFSPPLHFNSPAFSYTRPAEPIVYAQVLRDSNGDKSKPTSTVHNDFPSTIHRSTNLNTKDRSPCRDIFGSDCVDDAGRNAPPSRQTLSTKFLNERNKELHGNNNNRKSPVHFNGDWIGTDFKNRTIHNSDEDEGFEDRKRGKDYSLSPTRDVSRQSSSEPPIIPSLRPSYGSIEHLANRRKLFELHERSLDFGRETSQNPKVLSNPKLLSNQYKHSSPIDEKHHVNGRPYDDRLPERHIVPPPRKQWAKLPKYYPETDLNDEFCNDLDALRREQARQRHKNYLDQKLNDISADKVIDLGYIDQYGEPKFINNNNSKIINQNLNPKARTKGRAPQPEKLMNGSTQHIIRIETERRKLDKVDSGIEHDFKRNRDIQYGDNNSR